MKHIKFTLLAVAACLLGPAAVFAQTNAPAQKDGATLLAETNSLTGEVNVLVAKVRAKLQAGSHAEADFVDEIKGFDTLLVKHVGENPDALAQVAILKTMLYLEVFANPDQGLALLKKVKTDYPTSNLAGKMDGLIAQVTQEIEAKKARAALVSGAPFPDFEVNSLSGQPLSVAALKGKVVLVDFWATWCPPCRAELPNVIATYGKFHNQGFEIIGVSLDTKRADLDDFLKKNKDMAWPQFFDAEIGKLAATSDDPNLPFKNKLSVKYGLEGIPFTILIGADGKIIGTDLRGDELGEAVSKALAKK